MSSRHLTGQSTRFASRLLAVMLILGIAHGAVVTPLSSNDARRAVDVAVQGAVAQRCDTPAHEQPGHGCTARNDRPQLLANRTQYQRVAISDGKSAKAICRVLGGVGLCGGRLQADAAAKAVSLASHSHLITTRLLI